MSRWGRRIFLLSDEREMKSGKIIALVKGVWEFCSYWVFTVVGKKELIDESNSRVSQ